MPWTFAHPAAILPLRRLCPRWLSLPGLVLGAMAPDLSYYIGMHGAWSAYCHTLPGVLLVCLPVCLLMLALLQRFAQPLTTLLPEPHRSLVREQLLLPARALWLSVAVAALSILLGAATHVLWDSFTHQGRWGAELLPELDEPLPSALQAQVHVTHLLQHVSSLVGAALLVFAYRRTLQRRPPAPAADEGAKADARRARLLLAALALAATVGAAFAYVLTPASLPDYSAHLVVRTVVWSSSCFATLFILASVAWWRRHGEC